jgi:hypothetical protein
LPIAALAWALLATLVATPAAAVPKQEAAPVDGEASALLPASSNMALLAPPPARAVSASASSSGAVATALPGSAVAAEGLPGIGEPPAMMEAVTVDLPVWPWSAPLDEGGRDDPEQGYNVWTYGFALALIVLGLTLGRRAVTQEKPRRAPLRRVSAAD